MDIGEFPAGSRQLTEEETDASDGKRVMLFCLYFSGVQILFF